MPEIYKKIVLPTRPQPDTIAGIFLLKTFGKEKYHGIENAEVEILAGIPQGKTEADFEKEGVLLIDIGKGKFDHHAQNSTASQLIAQDLGVSDSPALAKLLAYAERDDRYGMGTISQDTLDKAFGLSGLAAALNKSIPHSPNEVIGYIIPLLTAHYLEERKRTEELPQEYKQKLADSRAEEMEIKHRGKKIKVVAVESNDPSMAGWLRSSQGVKADVVIQKMDPGCVNIMTKQIKKIDLRGVAALLRKEELSSRNRNIGLSPQELTRPGRISQVPEWYYDRATNSLLNGGLNPKGIEATKISFQKIQQLVLQGLQEL
jgi:hypothetical protein